MSTLKHDLSLRLAKTLNAFLIVLPFGAVWILYYMSRMDTAYPILATVLVPIAYLMLYVYLGRIYNAFTISYTRVSEIVYSQVLAACIADGLIYLAICFLCKRIVPVWPGLLAIAAQICLSILWAILSNKWYFRHFAAKKTHIVYDSRLGMDELVREHGLTKKFDVQKVSSASEVLENLDTLADAEVVFLSGVHSHDRNVILKYCTEKDIRVLVLPRIGDVLMSSASRLHILHLPILMVRRYPAKPEYLFIKRVIDILLSGIALLILSPVFLIAAILIKRDGGPVFYRQERLTKDGKRFKIIKFRSMRVDAEKDGVARLSTGENDDRITPVGRVLRKLRIDELPQLLNILKGDMSIVGPRPERPEIAEQYEKEMPEFRLRLQCKAGLTGYAQVYGKYNTTPYDKLMMDLMYIADPGLVQDLRIIFATVKILFLPESTEGVAVGATTAMDYENPADSTENDAETVTK